MPDMTTSNNNPWLLDKTIQANEESNNVGRFHASLSTAGKLLDRNIELDIDTVAVSGSIGGTAAAGKATAAISNVNNMATINSTSGLTAGTDYWEVKATAAGIAGGYTPKYTVSSSGWLHSDVIGPLATINVTGDSDGLSIYIKKATFTNVATSGVNYTDISNTNNAPVLISGDYLYINKGYTKDLKISLAKLVPDWDNTLYPNVAASDKILSGYVAYNEDGNIITGTIDSMAGGTKYATTSNLTLSTQGKYLTSNIIINKISAGTNYEAANIKYNVTTKINNGTTELLAVTGTFTKASTVSSGLTAAAAAQILSGYSAWVNGVEVKGNIANGTGITFSGKTATVAAGYYATVTTADMSLATITSGTDLITSGPTYTYNSTNSNFDILIGTSITAPSVGTAGYISPTEGTKNTNTNTLTATVAKVVLATVEDSGNLTMAPTLVRTARPSGDTWTDAADGEATTVKPTNTKPYVLIDAAEKTNVLKIKGKVKTAGYGTTTNFDTDINDYTVGAAAATTRYIPIKTATPAFDGGEISGSVTDITGSNVTLSDTSNGISITGAASAGRAAVLYNGAVEGWVSLADNTSALAATNSNTTLTGKTRYITEIIVPGNAGFTLKTAGSADKDTNIIEITNVSYRTVNISNEGWTTINHTSLKGTDYINAYLPDGSTKSGELQLVVGGKWKKTTITPNTTTLSGYGYVEVSPISSSTQADATVSATTQAPAPRIDRTTIGGTRNVSNGDSTTTAPSSGYYVTATATVPDKTFAVTDITKTINTAGYLGADTQITASANLTTNTSSTYYIPVASNTITGSTVDLVAPSVAITTSTSSGLNISNSATNYYIEITGTPTNGSVKGKATAGSPAGIVAAGATHTLVTATTITPTITGSGNKVYLTAAEATVTAIKKAIAPNITTSETSITGANRVAITPTTTSPSSAYYVAFKALSPAITNFPITKIINTVGYLSSDTQITATTNDIKTTASDNVEYYIPMNEAKGIILTSGNITTEVDTAVTNKIDLVTAANKTNDIAVKFLGSGTINVTTKTTTPGYSANNVTGYAESTITASSLSNTTYYVRGVEIEAPTTPGESSSFYITVPNGNSGTVTFNFHVDSNGEVTID